MSRYDVLAKRTSPTPQILGTGKSAAARRGNPAYRQFSAYLPADLYRALKVRLAECDIDLSQAVEQALTDWIKRQSPSS
jgi:hypothetical protein